MTLLQLQSAQLAFGDRPLLADAALVVQPGERICLVGRNGAGKSTLLAVLERRVPLDSGQLWWRDGLRLACLRQDVPVGDDSTLFDVVASGLPATYAAWTQLQRMDAGWTTAAPEEVERLARQQANAETLGVWSFEARVEAVLDRLRLPRGQRLDQSSGGVRRRALLGQALVAEPDLLLLDEPTNHLDIESISALEEAIQSYPGAVIFITHDRAFVDRLATRIIELDRGELRSYPGSYAQYQARKAAELDIEAVANRRFDQVLAAEEVWIRQGIKARRTRNEGRVRRLEAMRRERHERLTQQGRVRMQLTRAESSGRLVFAAHGLVCGHAGRGLFAPLELQVDRGDRIGIVGANGSGKTTLLRTLVGELEPVSGRVERGTRVEIAYFDQERQALDPESTVRDVVADGADHVGDGASRRHVAGYLADFLFPSSRIHSPVKSLSGGERNRLLLARLFAKPVNVLVLDEPTNDLDLDTLELLEERIADFDGTLFIVSHDRRFLDLTVTSLLIVGEDGVVEFPGGYSEWQAHVGARARPHAGVARTSTEARPAPTNRQPVLLRKKLNNREQRELESLPGLIEQLESRQSALQSQATRPDFYRRPKEEVAAAVRELEDVSRQLEEAYGRWAELEG